MADDVEEALRLSRKYEPALKDYLKREPELKEYRPSLKERIAAALMGEERPTPERRNFAEGLSELAYYVPGIGEAIAGDRLGRSIATEDYLTALKTALGVIPGTGKLVTDRLPKAFGGQAYANDMAMVGAKKGGRINTTIDRDPDWDMGLAAGGEVENALRLARHRLRRDVGGVNEPTHGIEGEAHAAPQAPAPVVQPNDAGQEAFLKEQLKGSAPLYVEHNDLPARVSRGIESVDRAAATANNALAAIAGQPEMRSPEGRSAADIVTSAIPPDPNEVAKQAIHQYQGGDRLGAAETMFAGMPQTGSIRAYHYSPANIEKFDVSKVGQGGAGGTSYGHGLYFGAKEDDARMWQRNINEQKGLPKGSGHMYEAQLNLDPGKMIDYNKYLHEQPEFVKNALINKLNYEPKMFEPPAEGEFGGGKPRGDMAVPMSEGAMKAWRDAGLEGVSYYDPSNSYRGYVAFSGEPIDILRKYAEGGEVNNALRLARKRLGEGGVPDESGEREFLQENLKGSAPQYVEQNDLPARVARGIEAADSAAGSVNDLAANALMIDAMRSPQGRKASEIITAPLPDDPNEVVKQAMRQYRRGDELGAAETMTESLPMTEMFIGKKAVLHPAERHAAEVARDMYDKGVDKGDILRHTRWFRGPEGPYRKEISDKSAEFFPDKVTGDDALHKIFAHDNLYERYPHLKDMSVVVDPNTKGDAYYSHGYGGKSPYIAISPEVAGKADLGRASLLHELQHAIQMHEDWAHGASPSNPAYQNIPKGSNPVTKAINSVLGRYVDPEVAYGRSLGEREAKNVEWRSKLPEEDLTYLHPLDTANHFYENSTEGPRDRFKGKVPSENELLVERPKDRAPMTLDEYLKTNPYAKGGEVDDALRLARASGGKSSAWTRKEGQNPEGGLNAKGRAAAKREGHNLKPPAPHPKNEKDAARRKSFCARMQGMKDELTSKETARDPDSRINKSLRAWNCADGGAVDEAVKLASGGKPVWNKPRPKSLGKSEPLSKGQKASAKAAAKKAGRPYPNLVDNMREARKGD